MPSEDEQTRMKQEQEQRVEALRRKYPSATTDSFQRDCMLWEMFSSGKGSWVVTGAEYDAGKIADSFSKVLEPIDCMNAGLVIQALQEQPDAPSVGFQAMCYEKDKELIKSKLLSIGIKESELSWTPESEHRKTFEQWKANYREE
ncbi:MAG TPA: hypothetical protein VMV84_06400 [Dehalococcoidales bacterium]|nr:hypothetical protein [Dehalococcoidales bacterium]